MTNNLPSQTFYTSSFTPDTDNVDGSPTSTYAHEPTGTRGRVAGPTNFIAPEGQVQQNGFAASSRSHSRAGAARSPTDLNSETESHSTAVHSHFRQASKAQGLYQHSRNTSYVNSPATSPLSPQANGSISVNAAAMTEFSSLTMIHHGAAERRHVDSPSSTLNGSSHNSSTTTLGGDREAGDGNSPMIAQKKTDRTHSVKGRRGHAHHRSQSKQPYSQEQKTVGEYALHHLFNSVSTSLCVGIYLSLCNT